jgi:signal transduction histidine kinase/ActR/RegA family two-component response regulator
MSAAIPLHGRPSIGPLSGFLLALAIVGAATLVRLALDPLVGTQAVYVIYTAATMVVARLCGRIPALVGIVGAAFTANYLFVPPRHELVPHGQDWVAMSVFALVAASIVWLVGRSQRAEELVGERAEELRAILDTAPAAVFVTRDPHARSIEGNATACSVFRVPPGSNLSLTAPEDERPTTFRSMKDGRELRGDELPMQMAMAGKGPVLDCDFDVVYEDGTARTLFGNAAALFDKEGEVRGAVGAFLDITERKRAEEALRDANRLKDEFLATLSHELRTPLNAIVGWSDMLRSGNLDAYATRKAIESIHRNAKAQNTLINDVLDVSRIIRGKVHLERRPVNLTAVIEHAVEAVRPAAEAKGVKVIEQLEAARQPTTGDPSRLRQVFWNLLANAIKFTPSGGQVRVSIRFAAEGAVVTVADTGIGISPEFLPQVFDRFTQSDSSITRRHSGLGLGLAIVRHIVELHGGTVEAESAGEGKGAVFTVRLPCPPVERRRTGHAVGRQVPAIERSLEEVPSLCGMAVLVVDDEPEAREVTAAVLRQHGASVRTAADADRAVESYAASRPDVVVLDIAMPDTDGYQLLRHLRERAGPPTTAVPAIALTALAREEDRQRAFSSGFQLHLSKPIDANTLVRAIATLRREA